MPEKIGSISDQWSKIGGGKKSTSSQDTQVTNTPTSQTSEQVKPADPDASTHQGADQLASSDTDTPVVQTSRTQNNELTNPQKDKEFELPDYTWADDSEEEDTSSINDQTPDEVDNRTTRNLRGKATKEQVIRASNGSNKRGTRVRVVQYTREVKPERLRQTVYLYPDVLRWIKRRIAETDEEISDVGNYTAELCMWLEEKHPEIIARFERQRRRQ